MYYPDLSAYAYEPPTALPGVMNIGWLDEVHVYATGPISRDVIRKLTQIAVQHATNQARGFHYCELCSAEEVVAEYAGKKRMLGSAEIWIPNEGGGFFASPDLLVHYMDAHRYKPPQRYLDAAMAVDLSTWVPPRDMVSFVRAQSG